MVILGIDPGYAIVGWGVIEYNNTKFKTIAYGAVTTPAGMDFSDRLERIYDEISLIIASGHFIRKWPLFFCIWKQLPLLQISALNYIMFVIIQNFTQEQRSRGK